MAQSISTERGSVLIETNVVRPAAARSARGTSGNSANDPGSIANPPRLAIGRQGPFTVELYWNEAPRTCRNFYELVRASNGRPVPLRVHAILMLTCAARAVSAFGHAGSARLLQRHQVPPRDPRTVAYALLIAAIGVPDAERGRCVMPLSCAGGGGLQDFMIQTGDPTGTGRGGASIYGYLQAAPDANGSLAACLTRGLRVGCVAAGATAASLRTRSPPS